MVFRFVQTIVLVLLVSGIALAQDTDSEAVAENIISTIRPNYMPPSQVLDLLGVRSKPEGSFGVWKARGNSGYVEVRHNDAANLLILNGSSSDVALLLDLIHQADVPPRQIEIEVLIVEIDNSKARDVGLDWDRMIQNSNTRMGWRYSTDDRETRQSTLSFPGDNHSSRDNYTYAKSEDLDLMASPRLADFLHTLDETGAGEVRSAPRILTLNNRSASILDGQRVTYITRYSSYTNLYETDSVDAGLTLKVLPSLGESGYITMRINAELTSLSSSISGSPIKDGQMLENTVIVRDGESVLLGGLRRSVEKREVKRFPILGHVLPFLFSRETTSYREMDSYIILTPRVVDLAPTLSEDARSVLEGN